MHSDPVHRSRDAEASTDHRRIRAELERACGLPLTSFRPEHVSEQVARACSASRWPTSGRWRARCAPTRSSASASGARSRSRTRRCSATLSSSRCWSRMCCRGCWRAGGALGAWSAGCSDGSELYTLGIVLERLNALDRALLLGSDLLDENLAVARAGDFDGRLGRAAIAYALGAARSRGRRPAARALAARALPQRRDLPGAGSAPAGVRDARRRARAPRRPAARAQRTPARPGGVRTAAHRPARL